MATQGPRKWLLALALILCLVPFSEGQKKSVEEKGAQAGRKHWAFQPVKKPRLPEVLQSAWVRNPIDAFILPRLEAKGLRPNPAAQPRALLRRIHLDLAGLPPTPPEQESLLGDPSAKALDRIIDSLAVGSGGNPLGPALPRSGSLCRDQRLRTRCQELRPGQPEPQFAEPQRQALDLLGRLN